MEKIRLGKTELMVTKNGFGALPVQRLPMDEAVNLLQKAHERGINFFDTARGYSDSEEKLGKAFQGMRKEIFIATKSPSTSRTAVLADLEMSLKMLRTDYIDILQLHNPQALPDPEDPDGSLAALGEAKKKGMIRFAGLSNHSLDVAIAGARSGHFDTIQFPLSTLSSTRDLTLPGICREEDCGLIAMKAMAGGLITNMATSFAFLRQYGNIVPIWGIQKQEELRNLLELEANPPALDRNLLEEIERDRAALSGRFCRGCGYCMPCPVDIQINWTARMSLLLRRAPYRQFLSDEWRDKMKRIEECTRCGQCREKCPYGLNTPELLEENLKDYQDFYREHA